MGLAALTSAAFGQIFSDVSGICFGGVVETAAAKLGLSDSGITPMQDKLRGVKILTTLSAATGVIVGCLLGMTSLLFMDLGAADRKRMQEELRPLFETIMQAGRGRADELTSNLRCNGGGHVIPTPHTYTTRTHCAHTL